MTDYFDELLDYTDGSRFTPGLGCNRGGLCSGKGFDNGFPDFLSSDTLLGGAKKKGKSKKGKSKRKSKKCRKGEYPKYVCKKRKTAKRI